MAVTTFSNFMTAILLGLFFCGARAFPSDDREVEAGPEKACSMLQTVVEDRVNVTDDECWTLCPGFCTAVLNLGLSGQPHSEFGVMTEAERMCALVHHVETFTCVVTQMAESKPNQVCVGIIDALNDLAVERGGKAYLPTNSSELLNVSDVPCTKEAESGQQENRDHLSAKLMVTDAVAKHQVPVIALGVLFACLMMWL